MLLMRWGMNKYKLYISFNSNEVPFATNYEPGRLVKSLEDAISWARGMKDGMGDSYTITLYENDKVIDYAK